MKRGWNLRVSLTLGVRIESVKHRKKGQNESKTKLMWSQKDKAIERMRKKSGARESERDKGRGRKNKINSCWDVLRE